MKPINRETVCEFFKKLVELQPVEERVALLIDILVNEFCFYKIDTNLEQEVIDRLADDTMANKIHAIKLVRERTNLILTESKNYVEAVIQGQRNIPFASFRRSSSDTVGDTHSDFIKHLNMIAKNYGMADNFF